jgi:hypothetical protein
MATTTDKPSTARIEFTIRMVIVEAATSSVANQLIVQ